MTKAAKTLVATALFLLAVVTRVTAQTGASFDARAFLATEIAPLSHEGGPHGVPKGYDWVAHSLVKAGVVPPPRNTTMNWWGELYVDASDVRAPNTRVSVKNGKLLVLYEGDSGWRTLQNTDDLGGGGWTEDFRRLEQKIDIKAERDGSRSFVPHD